MTATENDDEAAIWNEEVRIFQDRAAGSMRYYLSVLVDEFVAWPSPAALPFALGDIRSKFSGETSMPAGERIELTKREISICGDTAVSFFETHRTRQPGGDEVDERFANIHVWIRRGGKWLLMSNMSRLIDQ